MSDEENVDDGVDELNEELGIKDAKEDVIQDPDKEETEKTSEAELAQKALDESSESAESAETEEEKVPLAKMMGWKNKARDLEVENAELRGENKVRSEMSATTQTASTAKSPMQLEMESQGVDDIDDLDLSTGQTIKLMQAEQAFETKQADSKAAETSNKTKAESCLLAKDAHGEDGLDFMSVISEGEKFLIQDEVNALAKLTDTYGEEAYKLCRNAIVRMGGDRAEEIQKLIDANNSNKQSDKETDEAAKKKAEEELAVKAKANSGKFDLEKSLNSDDDTGSEAEQKPNKRLLDFMESQVP